MNARHFLHKYLVIPFVAAAALCVLVSTRVAEPWKGLSVNVAAAFLGSIVTVFYVDKVLNRHQETVWASVRAKVLARLETVANATVSSVRTAFEVELPNLMHDPTNLALMREEMLRMAEKRLVPARGYVQGMDQDGWRILALNLQGSAKEVDRLLTLFWRNLSADQTALLLQVQEDAQQLLVSYSIFPDISVSLKTCCPGSEMVRPLFPCSALRMS